MPTTTTYGGYTVPVLGDSNNVPSVLGTLAQQVEPWLVTPFANSADRTAKMTAYTTATGVTLPKRGMISWLDSPGRHEYYDGTNQLPLIPAKRSWPTTYAGTAWDGVSTVDEREYTAVITVGNAAGGWSHTWLGGAFPNGVLFMSFTVGDTQTGTLPVVDGILPIFAQTTLSGVGGVCTRSDGSVNPNGQNFRANVRVVGW